MQPFETNAIELYMCDWVKYVYFNTILKIGFITCPTFWPINSRRCKKFKILLSE